MILGPRRITVDQDPLRSMTGIRTKRRPTTCGKGFDDAGHSDGKTMMTEEVKIVAAIILVLNVTTVIKMTMVI